MAIWSIGFCDWMIHGITSSMRMRMRMKRENMMRWEFFIFQMFRHNSPAARFKVPLLFHLIASGELPWSVLIRCIDNVVVIFTKRCGIIFMVLEWVNSLKMGLVVDLYLHIMTRRSKRTNALQWIYNKVSQYNAQVQHWLPALAVERRWDQVLLLMVRSNSLRFISLLCISY